MNPRPARRAAALLALAWGLNVYGPSAPPPARAVPGPGPGAKLRVAVLPFDNASTDKSLAPLGKGLQAMVTTDLSQISRYDLVERARLLEIQKELSLQRTGAIDKATAAKVGKLAGASHLLTGSFTVVGDTMRIDARLFAVGTGKVLLADKVQGDKEAFFDLEKDLVGLLVKTTGVHMAPKERRKVARVHTADFKAFKKYSEGLAHFDAKDYVGAAAAMRQATKIDEEFDLAQMSLAEYERLASQMHDRAADLKAAKEAAKLAKRGAEAKREAEILKTLWARVGDPPKAGDTEGLVDYLLALRMLTFGYSTAGNYNALPYTFEGDDAFALHRLGDGLCRRYWDEALDAWPLVPLTIDDHPPFDVPLFAPGKLDQYYKYYRSGLLRVISGKERAGQIQRRMMAIGDSKFGALHDFATCLGLDSAGEERFMATYYDRMRGIFDEARWHETMLDNLARAALRSGRLDAAARWLAKASNKSKDPRVVERMAARVASLKQAKKLLAHAKRKDLVRELLFGPASRRAPNPLGERWLKDVARLTASKTPTSEVLYRVSKTRSLRLTDSLFWGDHPLFLVSGGENMVTGARPKPWHTDGLRYYLARLRRGDERNATSVAVLDGREASTVTLAAKVSYAPPKDFWHEDISWSKEAMTVADRDYNKHPAEVMLVFGLRDIDVPRHMDPATKRRVLTKPMTAWAVSLRPDADEQVRLVRLTEPRRLADITSTRLLKSKVVGSASQSLPLDGPFKVKVSVKGRKVTAKVDGKTHRFTLPAAAPGYYGVAFWDAGFAAVDHLKAKAAGGPRGGTK